MPHQSSIFYKTCATIHSYNSTDIRMDLFDTNYSNLSVNMRQDTYTKQSSMQTRRRHVVHYAQFGDTDFLEHLDDIQQRERGQFSEELDNFIIAIEYATDSLASKCCFAALKILRMKGPSIFGR